MSRRGVPDHLLLLMTFRHGLRVSEAVALRRDELDLDRAGPWVRRLKGGLSVEQPVAGESCARSSAPSPPARTRCPGCSSLSAASRSPGSRSTTSPASRLGVPACLPSTRIYCGTPVASRWPTRATTSGLSRTTSATVIPGTPPITPARQASASRGCNGERRRPKCTASRSLGHVDYAGWTSTKSIVRFLDR